MEIPSRVHGGFKINKPNRFSNVQKILKPWSTIMVINFRMYLTIFPKEKNIIIFVILYLNGIIFNWVQPRLENLLVNNEKKKPNNKKRSKCFTNSTTFAFT